MKGISFLLQFLFDFNKIVKLTIVYDHVPTIIDHGLCRGWTQVNDGQATMSKAYSSIFIKPCCLTIRAAVLQSLISRLEKPGALFFTQNASYATHISLLGVFNGHSCFGIIPGYDEISTFRGSPENHGKVFDVLVL